MRQSRFLIATVVAVTVLAACGSDNSSTGNLDGKHFQVEKGTPAVTVDLVDNTIEPQYVSVRAGTTVTFVNRGHNKHNVVAVGDGFKRSDILERGDSYKVIFEKPGDFALYCSLHGTASSGMTGGVRVVT